jgi:hypothetical protein
VRRRIRHPPAGARGAEAAAFARESDQLVLAALRATQARESVGKDAAGERPLEFAGHEARQAEAMLLARAGQEGREVLAQQRPAVSVVRAAPAR